MKKVKEEKTPIYSHNRNEGNDFPLLVLDVKKQHCYPGNEGFLALHWHEEVQFIYVLKGKIRTDIFEEVIETSAGDALFILINIYKNTGCQEAPDYWKTARKVLRKSRVWLVTNPPAPLSNTLKGNITVPRKIIVGGTDELR